MMKKLCCLLLCLASMPLASALPEVGPIYAKSAALYAASGQMLYEYNAAEELQPASVTKIMTMLLTMEALERGEVTLDTMITGSEYACSMGGTQIWLEPGEQMSLDEMLKAIAVGSANDCAVAVAEHLAGTEAAFVEKMNTRARELGCTGTQFINANGLDGIGQQTLTSAHDLALIAVELLRHPLILKYTGIWMDSIRGGTFSLANTNKMLKSYPGMTGLKTGYISQAGFCIAASAERDGLSLVAVVMAAPTKENRSADVATLLNYGFANYAVYTPDTSGLAPVLVEGGTLASVMPQVDAAPIVVTKSEASGLTTEVEFPNVLLAPIERGQHIGTLHVRSGERELLALPIQAAESVEKKTLFDRWQDYMGALL